MASPVVAQVVPNSTPTAGTSHTINHPTVVAEQLWLIILDKGSTSATVNAHADWTELLDEASANGLYIAYRWTTGGEGASTTLVTSASTRTASHVYRITGAENPATQAPQIGTTSSGSSAIPDPPASATPPSSKDYLFIAFYGAAGEEADDNTWSDTPPTNYTPSPPRQKACGVAGTNLGGLIAAAERALTTGVAENPGTFAKDVSAAWRAQTVMVHPAASVTNFQTLPATAIGVSGLSRVATYLRTLAATAVGSAVLTPALLFVKTLAATAVGVAMLTAASLLSVTVAAVNVGSATLSRVSTFFKTLVTTDIGEAALSRVASFVRALAATSTGVAALSRVAIYARALAATAQGITAIGRALLMLQSLAATAIGSAAVTTAGTFSTALAGAVNGVVGLARTLIIGDAVTTKTLTATHSPKTGMVEFSGLPQPFHPAMVRFFTRMGVEIEKSGFGYLQGSIDGFDAPRRAYISNKFNTLFDHVPNLASATVKYRLLW